jgi:hypothetical protein
MSLGGVSNEDITHVRWVEDGIPSVHESSTEAVMRWIANGADSAYVSGGAARVAVEVVRAAAPYLQSCGQGALNDDLLQLPRY